MKTDHYLRILNSQVVGYQNKVINDSNAGGFTSLLSTIPAVGADLEKTTLADFVVTPPEGGLAGPGSIWLTTFDAAGQVSGDYCYLDELNGGMMGADPGWYTKESVDNWTPESAANTIIAFGEGVQILSDCGASVTFAGEVLDEAKTFEIVDINAGGFTSTGNCSPVDLTLKDFSITPPEGGLAGPGSIWLTKFDDAGQVCADYCYLDELNGGMMGADPGWYTKESVDNWTPESAGNVEIKAGEMFQILSDCGATITVPSALN